MKHFVLFFIGGILVPVLGNAHQPVFDMAPRWANGYGFQIRHQSIIKDELETDGNKVSNPTSLEEKTRITWWEGIYTLNRAFRTTLKIPYIYKEEGSRSTDGVGDIIWGFPMKRYFNKEGLTGNFSFTPSVILPTGSTSGPIKLGRGAVDYGLSASFSAEVFRFYTLFDVVSRIHTRGNDGVIKGNVFGFDWDLGVHPYHNNKNSSGVFLMLGLNGRQMEKDEGSNGVKDPNTGGRTFEVAPTFVAYWKNWMIRTQYHIPLVNQLNGTQLIKTSEFQAGIGVTF